MRAAIETDRLLGGGALVFIDGRHTAARQWEGVRAHLKKEAGGKDCGLIGVMVFTDNPNYRPRFSPGQKVATR